MLSENLEAAFDYSQQLAIRCGNSVRTIEHLAVGLLAMDAEVRDFFESKKISSDHLSDILINFIKTELPASGSREPIDAEALGRVINRANFLINLAGRDIVHGLDIIDCMFPERDSFFGQILVSSLDLSREDVRRYHARIRKTEAESGNNDNASVAVPGAQIDSEAAKVPEELEMYLRYLNADAIAGRLGKLIGRQAEISRIFEILCRKKKSSVIIVGESGVGKTALAEGVALEIVMGRCPDNLKNSQIYAFDVSAAFAGTQFRGMFEERIKAVTNFMSRTSGGILIIDDDIDRLFKSSEDTPNSGAGIIKNDMARGNFKVIANAGYKVFNTVISKDAGFVRQFTKVDLPEPSIEDAVNIVKSCIADYEKHHAAEYPDDVIESAVKLCRKHIHDRRLPDIAFDVIDEMGAISKMRRNGGGGVIEKLTDEDARKVVSKLSGAMIDDGKESEADKYRTLQDKLKSKVFGQDQAIEAITSAVIMNKSGLDNDVRPIGSFLFAGPTGVGKTEIALQLARNLGMNLIRLDMSEFSLEHESTKLLGSAPGFVGHDEEGILTSQMRNHPSSVLLLDEIEKAHPRVYNIFLQIMDNGMVTDSHGVKVNFRDAIIIMTSNCGAADIAKGSIGFTADDTSIDQMAMINKHFTPEFRNRLDAIVWFNNLSRDHIEKVFWKMWGELDEKIAEKNVRASITDAAKEQIIKIGYDKNMGARPMRRALRDKVHKVLSREILFGQLLLGGEVSIDFADGEFKFSYVSLPASVEDPKLELNREKIRNKTVGE